MNAFYEKGNEISNNGDISSNLKDTVIRLLQSINKGISNLPSPQPLEIRFTAGNDTAHAASNSRHPSGNALDFTLGSPSNPTWGNQLPNNKTYSSFNGATKGSRINNLPAGPLPLYPSSQYEYINLIDTIIRDFVKTNLGTNYINEYYNPSSDASGPHFHFSISGGQSPLTNTTSAENTFIYYSKFATETIDPKRDDLKEGDKVTVTIEYEEGNKKATEKATVEVQKPGMEGRLVRNLYFEVNKAIEKAKEEAKNLIIKKLGN